MKKVNFLLLLFAFCFDLKAQVAFNKVIYGTSPYFPFLNEIETQTITHDQSQNIIFISQPDLADSADFEIIKLDQTGSFVTAWKFMNNNNYRLFPYNIISTEDDGFILTGVYEGKPPAQYPVPPNIPNVNTIFYAKLDNNLNLIHFKVHVIPFNQRGLGVYNTRASDINNDGVEEYVLCYNNSAGTSLLMLDVNLNPLIEKRYGLNISRLDYLPNNNVYALTSISGYGIGGTGKRVSIALVDANLDLITPLKSWVHVPDYGNIPNISLSGVVEQGDDPTKIIWSYSAAPTGNINLPCDLLDPDVLSGSKENTYVVKMDINGLTVIKEREFTSECAYTVTPIAIYNNPSNEGVVLGINQMNSIQDPSGNVVPNVKGALMTLDYDLNLQSSYIYNPNDITYINPGASFTVDLRYFYPFAGMIGDSYILHISFNGHGWHPAWFTRIINAYPNGEAECSEPLELVYADYEPEVSEMDLAGDSYSVHALDLNPVLLDRFYDVDYCGASNRQTVIKEKPINENVRIFPNPVTQDLLYIQGKLPTNATVTISDFQGRKIFTTLLHGDNIHSIDISEIASGIYELNIMSSNSIIRREKLVIAK